MKKLCSLLLASLVTVFPASGVLAGNVYKWVDENGVVHYTDQKPNERQAQQMNIRTTQGGGSAASAGEDPASAVEQLKRQQEIESLGQRQVAEEAQEKKQKQELCDNARKNLEVIQNSARIKVDENGSQRFLTPEEIIQKREQFEKTVQENCQ